ncbi:MAG: bifunctional glutamate N-acetyltransferase/amino-acid acetyltransferase ArgJ [Candidatus Omnitrophica bacterium]|nr:bifunctional glutamate N-acetyltransferase/amino-acid acetyltransferase ArgJ [Candidatus Omnitrophota bacterium]MCB9721829.1 bifunctional glutamate N-acetyltransferase/amino-acid acetyltransferase ArgJ [Candidatus Omnitrophota bacterium]
MKVISGGITKPEGFRAHGMWSGIKRSQKKDLSLVVSDIPATTASVYTQNSVVAAPITVCRRHGRNGRARAIIVNSGNANCFTGKQGYADAVCMAEACAAALGIKATDVLVASTGIIGKPLPIEKITTALPALTAALSPAGGKAFAQGILTTDLVIKERTVRLTIGGKTVTIGGCAKGSGMIAPNMATMLGFITTDAAITGKMLKQALKEANEDSFNCISVDGCMSTNDMLTVLANGMAGNPVIDKPGKEYDAFRDALKDVCLDLAKKIVLDGEGATKFVTIHVKGTKTAKQAREIGLMVANSMLVKTAIYGSNPNWGRVAAAVGALGIKGIEEDSLDISFSSFKKKDVSITTTLQLGRAEATVYTSDLTHEYIRINTEYN